MSKTRIYYLRPTTPTGGDVALIRAASPAAAVRHWADSMLSVVRAATPDDVVAAMSTGVVVEVADRIPVVDVAGAAGGDEAA